MRAVDRATAAYFALALLALLGPGRPAIWLPLLLAHLVVATGLLALARRPSGRGTGGWLRHAYPLLLLPALYLELPLLNQSLVSGYRDASLLPLEAAVFGSRSGRALAAALPWPLASELCHLAYLSYYPLIYGPFLLLALRRRCDAFAETLFAVMTTYYLCYIVYLVAPVQGPWFLIPPPDPVAPGPAARCVRFLLTVGASRGTAFPSSHLAVVLTHTLLARRFLPRWAPWMALAGFGIALGAVYAGIHYAIDMVAGALLAPAAVWLSSKVYSRLAGTDAVPATRLPAA